MSVNNWETDQEYIDLMNFLIENTVNVKCPMNLVQLAKKFKEESRSSQAVHCLRDRILRARLRLPNFQNIDTEAKAKLVFALGISVDVDFLNELKTLADVTLDAQQRIIEYKTRGGGLELSGKHQEESDQSKEQSEQILKFLAQKSREISDPLLDSTLVREFKEATGSMKQIDTLRRRYRRVKNQILNSEFDKETKVRMMFVSGAKLGNCVLGELRKDALVEVDDENRITKYVHGSLHLEGDQSSSAKQKTARADKRRRKSTVDDSGDEEEDDDSDEELEDKKPVNVKTKSGRVVKERRLDTNFPQYEDDLPASRKTTKTTKKEVLSKTVQNSSVAQPDDMELEDMNPNVSLGGYQYNLFDEFPQLEPSRRVKLEPFTGAVVNREMLMEEDDDDIQIIEIPALLEPKKEQEGMEDDDDIQIIEPVKLLVPKQEVMEAPVKMEAVEVAEEATQSKFLRALHSLILTLDIPSLKSIQTKIEAKIQRINDKSIKNSGILLALGTCVYRMTENSSDRVDSESMSLTLFLCTLKAVVVTLKFNGIDSFLADLKEKIGEISGQDKRVPIAKVESALQAALDVVDL